MSEKVRAKFKCNSVTDFGQQKEVSLSVVISGSEENKTFSKYTPVGELKMRVDKETSAFDYFQPQKEYYLSFEEAEKTA